ncbi:MAG: metal-dependent transcriptional regulator [Salinarchaeum sp.]
MGLTSAQEDALKALFHLEEHADTPVTTSVLAESLGKAAPTVTNTLDTLETEGLVEREPYEGAELTPSGELVAIEVLRHHRLLETFLMEQLDYPWEAVHAEAEALEHHISEEFEARIADTLGDPVVDPHGDPIPDADLEVPRTDHSGTLAECEPGETITITRVTRQEKADLAYLAERGINPGTTGRIVERAPFGMITLIVDDQRQSVPQEIAEAIYVRHGDAGRTATAAQEG